MGRYTVRQADRVTDRQNDSMTVWQNSRAAKEPALVSSDGPLAAIGREDLVDHVELVQLLMIEPHSYYLLGQV